MANDSGPALTEKRSADGNPTTSDARASGDKTGTDAPKGVAQFRSTWHEKDKKTWGIAEWFFHLLDIDPQPPNMKFPVHEQSDKMPYVSEFDLHRWILPRALVPFLIHCGIYYGKGIEMHTATVFLLYTVWFKIYGIMNLQMLRNVTQQTGFLDGKHPRDGLPDESLFKVMTSLVTTSTYRPMMATILAYDPKQPPMFSIPWIIFYIGIYNLVLDFYFYWYHRAMHDVSWLWKFHSTHHKTKHPVPQLTLFADEIQEIWDIAIIPYLAYFTMKTFTGFNFYDWWLCSMYQVFVELSGHSGARLHATNPSTFGILQALNLEIVIEDHDNHHLQGYRKSGNYGKQSRFWDHLFGTTMPRRETIPENMEKKRFPMPW